MNSILQITSGRGPAECCWVVAQVLKFLLEEARDKGLKATVLHREKGPENGTVYSATIQLKGEKLSAFEASWTGTVQWIGKSQFRKFHKRKNWFVGINKIEVNKSHFQLEDKDLKFDAIRSGGPGGQHANKVSSAVRATHIPTGLAVLASDQRSQLQNKKLALKRLTLVLQVAQLNQLKQSAQNNWQNHNELKRGNPIRVFEGSDFKRKKKNKKYDRSQSKNDFRSDIEHGV